MRRLLFLPVLLGALAMTSHSQQLSKEQKRDLFLAAVQRAELKVTLPYELRAKITIFNDDGEVQNGTYSEISLPPSRFRTDLLVGEAVVSHGTTDEKGWNHKNPRFVPFRMYQVQQLFNELRFLSRLVPEKPKIIDRKGKLRDFLCVERRDSAEVCVSRDLVEETVVHKHWQLAYGDFQSFGEVTYPRKMRVFEKDRLIAEVVVERLSLPKYDAAAWEPPAEAQPIVMSAVKRGPDCAENKQGRRVSSGVAAMRLKKSVAPKYPDGATRQRLQGTVSLFVTIGADGLIYDLVVIRSAGEALDQAAIDAVRQWQYKPTELCGVPASVETTIDVVFNLG